MLFILWMTSIVVLSNCYIRAWRKLEQGPWVLWITSTIWCHVANGWQFWSLITTWATKCSFISFHIRKWDDAEEAIQRPDEIFAASWVYACAGYVLQRIDLLEGPVSAWSRIHRIAGLFLLFVYADLMFYLSFCAISVVNIFAVWGCLANRKLGFLFTLLGSQFSFRSKYKKWPF